MHSGFHPARMKYCSTGDDPPAAADTPEAAQPCTQYYKFLHCMVLCKSVTLPLSISCSIVYDVNIRSNELHITLLFWYMYLNMVLLLPNVLVEVTYAVAHRYSHVPFLEKNSCRLLYIFSVSLWML